MPSSHWKQEYCQWQYFQSAWHTHVVESTPGHHTSVCHNTLSFSKMHMPSYHLWTDKRQVKESTGMPILKNLPMWLTVFHSPEFMTWAEGYGLNFMLQSTQMWQQVWVPAILWDICQDAGGIILAEIIILQLLCKTRNLPKYYRPCLYWGVKMWALP